MLHCCSRILFLCILFRERINSQIKWHLDSLEILSTMELEMDRRFYKIWESDSNVTISLKFRMLLFPWNPIPCDSFEKSRKTWKSDLLDLLLVYLLSAKDNFLLVYNLEFLVVPAANQEMLNCSRITIRQKTRTGFLKWLVNEASQKRDSLLALFSLLAWWKIQLTHTLHLYHLRWRILVVTFIRSLSVT